MSIKIKCIIVDDEPLARKGLEEYVGEVDFLDCRAVCENASKAASILANEKIDLIFLDIQMPRITGIELVKTLRQQPMIIFTTAYSDYALQSYELEALDYLVKPISFERFLKSVNRAKEFFELKQINDTDKPVTKNYFFVKCDSRYEKIFFDDLLFVKAMENYVVLQTVTAQFISYLTFKSVEEYFPTDKFIKVHKSYIVSIPKVDKIEGNQIKVGQHTVPISRNLKDEVMAKIVNDKLLRR